LLLEEKLITNPFYFRVCHTGGAKRQSATFLRLWGLSPSKAGTFPAERLISSSAARFLPLTEEVKHYKLVSKELKLQCLR